MKATNSERPSKVPGEMADTIFRTKDQKRDGEMKTHRQENDERHEKRLARYAEIAFMRLNKRQLARFLRVKSHVMVGLRKALRMTNEELIWAIVDIELPSL